MNGQERKSVVEWRQLAMAAGEGTWRGGNSLPQTFLLPGNIVFLRQGFAMMLRLVLNLGSSYLSLPGAGIILAPRSGSHCLSSFPPLSLSLSESQMSDTVEFVCTLGSSCSLPLTPQLFALVSPLQGFSSGLISGHSTRCLFHAL